MKDPSLCKCGAGSRVVETEHAKHSRRRRRACPLCPRRWTTHEIDDGEYRRLLRLLELEAEDSIRTLESAGTA